MPTITTITPDSYNIDYYFAHYTDRYGIGFLENEPEKVRVLTSCFNPQECDPTKKRHYMRVPQQPQTAMCLCNTYHTTFTSEKFRYSTNPRPSTPTQPTPTQPITDLSNKIFKKSDLLPQSPIKLSSQPTATLLFPSATFMSAPNTDLSTIQIAAHSHHSHTCAICHKQNITCAILPNSKHIHDTSATIIKERLIHKLCFDNMKISIQQNKPFNLSPLQKFIWGITKFITKSKQTKRNILKNIKLSFNSKTSQFSRDTTKDFDWFINYPITEEMKPFTQLNTSLASKIFKFIQPHLINFKPGQTKVFNSKQQNNNSENKQQESKYTFKNLLRTITGQRPEFLTNFIYEANPEISKEIEIPFDILYNTFTSLLSTFTEVLFTKLNYKQIFCSHSNIPPYSIPNRNQIALNFARLHLYLNHTYTTINSSKFFKDLEIKPIRMQFHYNITEDLPDKPLVNFRSDHKFNIYIDLNIPKQNFLNTFQTPSLKECNYSFEKWYNPFFEIYSRQFILINKTKTMNYIKYQTYLKLSSYLKSLLPNSYQFTDPVSLLDRSKQTTKATLYHLHICTYNSTKTCSIINSDNSNQLHDFKTISNLIFKQSFKHFPVISKMQIDEETKVKIIQPTLDLTIFDKDKTNQASFNIPTPIPLLNKLADEAEKQYISLNQSETNPKRRTYYFYYYFRAFLLAAATNDGIQNLSENEAIKTIIQNPINTHFLARIITYFNISNKKLINLSEIRLKYKTTFYPQAQQIILDTFKIKFTQPKSTSHSLFFNNTKTSKTLLSSELDDNLTENTIESTSNSPKLSYAEATFASETSHLF
jgi:hypothetical protein